MTKELLELLKKEPCLQKVAVEYDVSPGGNGKKMISVTIMEIDSEGKPVWNPDNFPLLKQDVKPDEPKQKVKVKKRRPK